MRHVLTHWTGSILIGALALPFCGSGAADDADEPPQVTVRYGDQTLELTAWAYCFGNVCADELPPTAPPHIGDPGMVVVEFPLRGWSFTATFVPAADDCVRAQRVQLESNGSGVFMLNPVGQADTYDVTLFGQGDGDLVVTFRWTTPRGGPPGNMRSLSQPCKGGTSP
jgi:hypothetical protein